ncbi:MAG: hypothetical protein JSV86_14285 [Gemmatimonadota bacterium]|nr:MAG: hypothetical protein JSV86_14285 [Gemmatimonadota bacterium]
MNRLRSVRAILPLIMLLAWPGALSGQDESLQRLRRAYPTQAAQIEGLLAQAEAAGVPAEPLLSKALEGAAKGVPAERVLAVLHSYAERLGEAGSLLGPERPTPELVAGADALRRGVPHDAVGRLARAHHRELAVPLVVLGDLMEGGMPAEQALSIVDGAIRQQQSLEDMLGIPAAARRLMQEGHSPDEAANAINQAMGQGQLRGLVGPPGHAPGGPPVPPGSGPPDTKGQGKQGKGKGKPPGGAP